MSSRWERQHLPSNALFSIHQSKHDQIPSNSNVSNQEIRCSTDRGIKIIIQFVGSTPFGLSALLRQLPQHLPDEVCNCSPVDNLFYNFTQLSGKNHNEASNVAAPAMPLRTLTGWKQSTCLQSALHYTCYDGFGCLNFWKWNTLADTCSYELHMTKNDDT